MSFTAELKTRLVNKKYRKKCCSETELSALIRMDGSIHLLNKKLTLEMVTENAAVARKVKQAFEKKWLQTKLTIRRSNLQKHSNYRIELSGKNLLKVISDLGITDNNGIPSLEFSMKELKSCCRKSFLKGLFLGGGYISNPTNSYRLQLITGNYNLAKEVTSFLNQNKFKASLTETKRDYHVNINNMNGVLKFLVWIDATDVALDVENVEIIKDMRNYANRLVNSDTANLKKTAIASMEQIKIIEYIRRKASMEKLPSALTEAAYLRITYPSLCLENLGKKSEPPLSKSAINHRFRRLKHIAEKLGY